MSSNIFRALFFLNAFVVSWDWGSCFAPIGIYKPLYIATIDNVLITDVVPEIFLNSYVYPWTGESPQAGNFDVNVKVFYNAVADSSEKLIVQVVNLTDEISQVVQLKAGENQVAIRFTVSNAELWWPRGYGSAKLYKLRVVLSIMGQESTFETFIGFRSAKVVQKPMPAPSSQNETRYDATDNEIHENLSFYFEINGVPIFAKGANYIPPDAFEDRITPDLYRALIQSSVDVNMNMLRYVYKNFLHLQLHF